MMEDKENGFTEIIFVCICCKLQLLHLFWNFQIYAVSNLELQMHQLHLNCTVTGLEAFTKCLVILRDRIQVDLKVYFCIAGNFV